MCRLLAVITDQRAALAVSLTDVLPGFTALSALHQDGWGVAGLVDGAVSVRKQPERASANGGFGQALGDVVSDAGLVHLRWASPGIPVSRGNTHPFVRDGMAFAHNGSIEPRERIVDLVAAELRHDLEGQTDSELYFRAVLTRMREVDPARALLDTAAALRGCCVVGGLNAMLLTRAALYVFADHDPDSAPSKRHGPDYFPIRYVRERGRVVVSSTGYERPGFSWTELPQRHVLRVERHTLAVHVIGAGEDLATSA